MESVDQEQPDDSVGLFAGSDVANHGDQNENQAADKICNYTTIRCKQSY